jgi:hypothetical protein
MDQTETKAQPGVYLPKDGADAGSLRHRKPPVGDPARHCSPTGASRKNQPGGAPRLLYLLFEELVAGALLPGWTGARTDRT